MIAKLKRLLNGIEQAAVLGERCERVEAENAELKARNEYLSSKLAKKNEEAISLSSRLAEVNSKIREQTEADLVLTSLKIIQGAMRGEKKDALSGLASVQQQLMAASQGTTALSSYGGALSNSFVGGIGGALIGYAR